MADCPARCHRRHHRGDYSPEPRLDRRHGSLRKTPGRDRQNADRGDPGRGRRPTSRREPGRYAGLALGLRHSGNALPRRRCAPTDRTAPQRRRPWPTLPGHGPVLGDSACGRGDRSALGAARNRHGVHRRHAGVWAAGLCSLLPEPDFRHFLDAGRSGRGAVRGGRVLLHHTGETPGGRIGRNRAVPERRRHCHGGNGGSGAGPGVVLGAARLFPARHGLLHAAHHLADQRHSDDAGTPGHRRVAVRGGLLSRTIGGCDPGGVHHPPGRPTVALWLGRGRHGLTGRRALSTNAPRARPCSAEI